MRVLITNDDGYDADGLVVLYNAVKEKYKTTIVAPLRNQSGVGSARTLRGKIRVLNPADREYVVDGTPVDCVEWAIGSYAAHKTDFVFAGLNHGDNTGSHAILCSGTIAAAAAAVMRGVPAIAFSQYFDYERHISYKKAPKRICEAIEFCHGMNTGSGCVYNVNLPDPRSKYRGINVARVSPDGGWGGDFVADSGMIYRWEQCRRVGVLHHDSALVSEGYMTITALKVVGM